MARSGAAERTVSLWHPRGDPSRCVGQLPGHVHGALAVAMGSLYQAWTLAGDGIVTLWDLRTLKQLQRVGSDGWISHDDARPAAMAFDGESGRLITGTRRPAVWQSAVQTGTVSHNIDDIELVVGSEGLVHELSRPSAEVTFGHESGDNSAMLDKDDADADAGSGRAEGDEQRDGPPQLVDFSFSPEVKTEAWCTPPLWMRAHSRLHLGAVPARKNSRK